MKLQGQAEKARAGYAMAALLVMIGVMGVMLSVAMPTWRQMVRREKEEELVFRGQQYARAIGLFQRKYAASFPPNVDTLVSQRFLRKKYADPMTEGGEFQILYQMAAPAPGRGGQAGPGGQAGQGRPGSQTGQAGERGGSTASGAAAGAGQAGFASGTLGARGGMIGVASKSTETSVRLYNGRDHYNEWQFVFAPALTPGQGQGRPGMPGVGGGRGGTGPGMSGRGGRGGRGGPGQPTQIQPGGREPR
jgi:type II secretory pathway pseudopilin PulG